MIVTLNGVSYEARGGRKKARLNAAFKALSDLDAGIS